MLWTGEALHEFMAWRSRRPAETDFRRPFSLITMPSASASRSKSQVYRINSFSLTQPTGGTLEGRAINTVGYRGMHSYEVSFSDWFVPAENLVGEEGGLGKGFYLQMEGFENGRLQTAARAVGLMQAAFEAGLEYAQQRQVFGNEL